MSDQTTVVVHYYGGPRDRPMQTLRLALPESESYVREKAVECVPTDCTIDRVKVVEVAE